ncbi:MFS transporter [Humitalea sp. 24SJ18S-53]|uniref:MFS transporter n=1 Tax=Humitalea sp. 24SJ18S-53 TaxID=3422307 RepID=UPI003D664FE1
MLWWANLAANTGAWVQNTGAGWMMTSIDPSPLMVSLVQASSLLPVFLLALPAGALADILDRRKFLIAAQAWMLLVSLILCAMTWAGVLGPWGLLALTFAVGAGTAMTFPGWAATTPELVPRHDLVQAIALNGMGFNMARSIGPALGGFVIGWFGTAASFAVNAVCAALLLIALLFWRREPEEAARTLPSEHFLSAMRAGVRFVAASPLLKATILRAVAFFFFGAAMWGLLPLLVREQLKLGPESFGLMLTAMGVGAVGGGFAMPWMRTKANRSQIVVIGAMVSSVSLALLGLSFHWVPAAVGMFGYGVAWIVVASTLQASAQFASPGWVRARAIGIYQLSFFGAMAAGSTLAGWAGREFGLTATLCAAGAFSAIASWAVRKAPLEAAAIAAPASSPEQPRPDAPAPELASLLHGDSGRVLEVVRYTVAPADRGRFLAAMKDCRRVRLRGGAITWRLYEDVAHPERWVELWAMENWVDHLRETGRMTTEDNAALVRAAAFQTGDGPPEAARYLNVMK